jgi:hypothetical protein
MTNKTERTHIVKRDKGWAVKKEGSQRATKVYTTKEKAIEGAEKSLHSGIEIIIHKKDGSIQKWKKASKK